jgi:hypothetical protein
VVSGVLIFAAMTVALAIFAGLLEVVFYSASVTPEFKAAMNLGSLALALFMGIRGGQEVTQKMQRRLVSGPGFRAK